MHPIKGRLRIVLTKGEKHMKNRLIILFSVVLACPAILGAQGLNTATIDQVLGHSGQKTGDVYRVGLPRTDLHVEVGNISLKPGFATGSWAAFSGTDTDASVMGDLVLTESEIGPVMAKLRAAGFEITAIHNHLLNETPHVMYMHYMGHGTAQKIAQALRDALAESKTPFTSAPPAQEAPPAPFVKTIEGVLGTQGRWAGGVLAFGLPRKEPIMDHGMTLNGAQGVAEAINFQEAGEGKVATTGDFVLIEQEVNSVISALEEHGIQVTALHNHMLDEQPRLLFMHFWAVGTPERVSTGIKAALSKIAVK
jgi:biotin operon repressor